MSGGLKEVTARRMSRCGMQKPSQRLLKRAVATLHILKFVSCEVEAHGLCKGEQRVRIRSNHDAKVFPIPYVTVRKCPTDPMHLSDADIRFAYEDEVPTRTEVPGVESLTYDVGYRLTHKTVRPQVSQQVAIKDPTAHATQLFTTLMPFRTGRIASGEFDSPLPDAASLGKSRGENEFFDVIGLE